MQGGRPVREDEHLCLEDGEVRLWVPRWMRFEEDRVRLEVRGFLWTARVEADSAILPHGCI